MGGGGEIVIESDDKSGEGGAFQETNKLSPKTKRKHCSDGSWLVLDFRKPSILNFVVVVAVVAVVVVVVVGVSGSAASAGRPLNTPFGYI